MAAAVDSTAIRPPPLTQSDAVTSLLSLGALDAAPVPIRTSSSGSNDSANAPQLSTSISALSPGSGVGISSSVGATTAGKHHRRLGSTGKTRRRLSDAREASTRPILASASPSSNGLLSLASLSLSTSPSTATAPKLLAPRPTGPSGISISALSGSAPVSVPVIGISESKSNGSAVDLDDAPSDMITTNGSTPIPISSSAGNGSKAKKRGVDYKCESCAKIYRHPNCLNKHRWEHTRQWREASKFVLSKHQQVQLLEAATILSYMGSQASTSLPEDRSEWPSFLSGGSLPKAEQEAAAAALLSASVNATTTTNPAPPTMGMATRTRTYPIHPVSSSVPVQGQGPRMYDYTVPAVAGKANANAAAGAVGAITKLRPGLVGVPTVPTVPAVPALPSHGHAVIGGSEATRKGWALPSSSVRSQSQSRSGSGSSSSRSRSGSRSEDSDIEVDVVDVDEPGVGAKAVPLPASLPSAYGYPGHGSYGTPSSFGGYTGVAYPVGYGYPSSYGSARRLGVGLGMGMGGMKREEDEMSVGFSVKEEDEDEEEDEVDDRVVDDGRREKEERRWDGMEMDLDMDMD